MIFILQLRLRTFASRADGLGIIPVECAGRFSVVSSRKDESVNISYKRKLHILQLGPVLVITSD